MGKSGIDRLRDHAFRLAKQHAVRIVEEPEATLDDTAGSRPHRAVFTPPITTEAIYSAVMHEFGHILHPDGWLESKAMVWMMQGVTTPKMLREERAAWEWARANALAWTPAMEAHATYALGTYESKPLVND